MCVLLVAFLAFGPLPNGGKGGSYTQISDKLDHVLAFFVMAFFLGRGFVSSGSPYLKFLPLAFYGLVIEVVQWFLPTREFSLLDVAADVAGILLYLVIEFAYLSWRPYVRNE